MYFCSKIGWIALRRVVWSHRSMNVGPPRGRFFPSPFGIHTRLPACGSSLFSRSCSLNRVSRLSARVENRLIDILSTPPPPFRALTCFHAVSRFFFPHTLSIRLCHLPPFTPFSRASSMRSVHTVGSVQLHRARTSPPRSSFRTACGCSSFGVSFTLPPSCPPLLHTSYGASSLLRGLCRLPPVSLPSDDDPRFTSHDPFCRSVSNHPMPPHVRFLCACLVLAFWARLRSAVSRLRASVLWVSHVTSKLTTASGRIEFLSYGPADSPPAAPHLTFGVLVLISPSVTQLPSALTSQAFGLEVSHLPLMCAHGRTGGRRPRRPWTMEALEFSPALRGQARAPAPTPNLDSSRCP